ncbi:MAG: hypothetical protein ACE1ZZ_03940, partial [Dehalococcoidia bacterium]
RHRKAESSIVLQSDLVSCPDVARLETDTIHPQCRSLKLIFDGLAEGPGQPSTQSAFRFLAHGTAGPLS